MFVMSLLFQRSFELFLRFIRASRWTRMWRSSWTTMSVTLLLFRPSESPFASLSSSFVSAPKFLRPARLRPRLHRQFVINQTVGFWSGARSSMKSCCVRASVARGDELLLCVQSKVNNSADVHGRKRSSTTQTEIADYPTCAWCVSSRSFLSFSNPISLDSTLHCSPGSSARASLQYETMSPTW